MTRDSLELGFETDDVFTHLKKLQKSMIGLILAILGAILEYMTKQKKVLDNFKKRHQFHSIRMLLLY